MSTDTIAGSAHAKINLGLEILRKRSDGYHELATVFCPISLSDEISCTRDDEGISLDTEGIHVAADATNLCRRAANLLLPFAGTQVGARISLKKNIPVGAGLGGGSSDAACVLILLNSLWGLGRSREELLGMAGVLGADVPYFIDGGLSYASGIGEKLAPMADTFPFWIVVVVPPEHVSTAWAYGQIAPRNTDTTDLRSRFSGAMQDLRLLEDLLRNDFEDVVLPAYPVIRQTMDALMNAGLACVRMSGTGSAVYGLSDSEDAARAAAKLFEPPYLVSLTPPGRP